MSKRRYIWVVKKSVVQGEFPYEFNLGFGSSLEKAKKIADDYLKFNRLSYNEKKWHRDLDVEDESKDFVYYYRKNDFIINIERYEINKY